MRKVILVSLVLLVIFLFSCSNEPEVWRLNQQETLTANVVVSNWKQIVDDYGYVYLDVNVSITNTTSYQFTISYVSYTIEYTYTDGVKNTYSTEVIEDIPYNETIVDNITIFGLRNVEIISVKIKDFYLDIEVPYKRYN